MKSLRSIPKAFTQGFWLNAFPADGKCSLLVWLTAYGQGCSHLFRKGLGNGQSQTVTACVFPGIIYPIKAVEDFIHMLWWDSFSRIGNCKDCIFPLAMQADLNGPPVFVYLQALSSKI